MTSQFIHLDVFGERARAHGKMHENAYDILDEAARMPGAAPHVRKPQPPTLLHGISPELVRCHIGEFAKIARDARGSRLRCDGTILYAVVVSYPVAWHQLSSEKDRLAYLRWRKAVVDWLKLTFGDRLQSVVEHCDEFRPHLHAFILPALDPRNRIDHRLHPGHAARKSVLENGGNRIDGERAYRDGMRRWQDEFHAAVSSKFGHDRVGPRRQRFRRDVALMRQMSDRFLEYGHALAMQFVQQLEGTLPALAPERRAEVDAIAFAFRNARQQLLSGRSDALETLASTLAKLADDGVAHGEEAPYADFGWDPETTDWRGDDDLRPEEFDGPNDEMEDDPDPSPVTEEDLFDDEIACDDSVDFDPSD